MFPIVALVPPGAEAALGDLSSGRSRMASVIVSAGVNQARPATDLARRRASRDLRPYGCPRKGP